MESNRDSLLMAKEPWLEAKTKSMYSIQILRLDLRLFELGLLLLVMMSGSGAQFETPSAGINKLVRLSLPLMPTQLGN